MYQIMYNRSRRMRNGFIQSKTPRMRFRLPSSGTAEVSPATQSYTHAGGARRPLPLTDVSTLTTTAITPDAADHLVAGDTWHFQGVSKQLAAQQLRSGMLVECAIQCLETDLLDNLFLQVWVGVYDRSGTTLLATLLAKTLDALELIATIQSRYFSATTTATYNCLGGERLVVELSVSGTPTATSGIQGHNASMRFGGSGAGGDVPKTDADVSATTNPWFEIDKVIFQGPAMPVFQKHTPVVYQRGR